MVLNLHVSIPLVIVSLVFGQNNEKNATNNEIQTTKQNDTSNSVPAPLDVICNQIETCHQYDKFTISQPQYRDLRTRKCMCDEECSTYGDCCKDSKYYNASSLNKSLFSCERTFFDGYIYMVTKCAPNYTNNSAVIEKCLTTNRTMLIRNFLLRLPVTNVLTKTTYKNAFCAICNYELNFDFFEPVFSFEFEKHDVDIILQNNLEPLRSNETHYEVVNGEAVLQNVTLDENRDELISQVDGSIYLCNILPNIHSKIAPGIRYCLSHLNDRLCSDCEKRFPTNSCISDQTIDTSKLLLLDNRFPHFPEIDSCNEIPANISNRDIFCPSKIQKDQPIPLPPGIQGGLFKNNNIRQVKVGVLTKFSIFSLFLYLATNVNKQKLQSLPNKILFSFCITLLTFYLVLEIGELLLSCFVTAVMLHFLVLSCFTWLLIASYDLWQVICRSSTKLQTLAGKTRIKRYLLYCFIGWISPLSIISVSLFFELFLRETIASPYKPGYGKNKICFITQYYPHRYFFFYPTSITFCIILTLFAHTSYHIYSSKRKSIKSTAQNNYYMLFLKLALTTGLTWMMGILLLSTKYNIFVFFTASYGTLMFFAYGFQKTMLTKIYNKHKNNSTIQQTKNAFFNITDRIESSSSLAS